MDTAFARCDSARLLSLGYILQELVYEGKQWTVCEPQRSSEWYRRHGMMLTSVRIRKAVLRWKRCLAAMAKQS